MTAAPTRESRPATVPQRRYFVWLVLENMLAVLAAPHTEAQMSEIIRFEYQRRERLGKPFQQGVDFARAIPPLLKRLKKAVAL